MSVESITTSRPTFITDNMLVYLDKLRESGKTNMFGARPYLMDEFEDLNKDEATKTLMYWMETFGGSR